MTISCTIEIPPQIRFQISSELSTLKQEYAAFSWEDTDDYRISLFTLTHVEEDLVPKMAEKIRELTVDMKPFTLFAFAYQVKIAHVIDLQLTCQSSHQLTELTKTLQTYFTQRPYRARDASIHVARYKIPSRQQYTHLKNKLEKIETNVEIPVNELTLGKLTIRGGGDDSRDTQSIIELLD